MHHLSLGTIESAFSDSKLYSYDSRNIASFKKTNYLGKKNKGVYEKALNILKDNNVSEEFDDIFILSNLEYLGYCFNPISIYFCIQGRVIKYLILEVTNTPWGERHCYVLKPCLLRENIYSSSFRKVLYVSPFLDMDYEYKINCKYTENKIIIHLESTSNNTVDFDATLSLNTEEVSAKSLNKYLITRMPNTIKTIVTIYWQAFKILLKGIRYLPPKKKEDK